MTRLSGWKTYATSIALAGVGAAFLAASSTITWNDPDADTSAAVKNAIGWVAILLAVGFAGLRHALATTERNIRRHIGTMMKCGYSD